MQRWSLKLLVLMFPGMLWLLSCNRKPTTNTAKTATVTLKTDGSQFSGTVARQDANSITITDAENETKTFLFNEISKVDDASSAAASGNTPKPTAPAGAVVKEVSQSLPDGKSIEIAAGVEIPVRSNGLLDACCMGDDSIALGNIDSDVKGQDGHIMIPTGANVTILVRHHEMRDSRVTLVFELGSADFNGSHYVVSAASGKQDEGAMVTFSGAQEGSPEARTRGIWLHLEDRSFMGFKTVSPTVFKLLGLAPRLTSRVPAFARQAASFCARSSAAADRSKDKSPASCTA